MAVIQEHESPDGLLHLFLDREGEDIIVGFAGSEWHTHADLLAPTYGPTEDEALANFVRDILENRMVLVVMRVAGEVCHVSVTDRPDDEGKYVPEDREKTVELRYWSGDLWRAD